MNYDEIQLQVNTAENRLELTLDGTALIEYKLSGDSFFLIHTKVAGSLEGKGGGGAIAQDPFFIAEYGQVKCTRYMPMLKFCGCANVSKYNIFL